MSRSGLNQIPPSFHGDTVIRTGRSRSQASRRFRAYAQVYMCAATAAGSLHATTHERQHGLMAQQLMTEDEGRAVEESSEGWVRLGAGNSDAQKRKKRRRAARRVFAREQKEDRLRSLKRYVLSKARMFCGAALACARAATPACNRICALVRLAASVAKLASRMSDSAVVSLVNSDCARLMAYVN